MRTNSTAPAGAASTFTQIKRRDQLVACAIDAIVEVGFARASVAEVARRAGVSKGVVTYHFAAKDDLIRAVIADVLASMSEYLEPRLLAADPVQHPERFIAPYITGWIGCYRALSHQMLALVGIYNNFRDESGLPSPEFDARARDIEIVTHVLEHGQADGGLGSFDPRVIATVMKAALDDLLTQYAANPDMDLEAYGAHLVALFERATQPATDIKE